MDINNQITTYLKTNNFKDYTTYANSSATGPDLLIRDNTSEEECANLCLGNSECNGFVTSANNSCILKNDIIMKNSNDVLGSNVYKKNTHVMDAYNRYTDMNMIGPGLDLGSSTIKSLDSCLKECSILEDKCAGIVYRSSDSACQLKSRPGPKTIEIGSGYSTYIKKVVRDCSELIPRSDKIIIESKDLSKPRTCSDALSLQKEQQDIDTCLKLAHADLVKIELDKYIDFVGPFYNGTGSEDKLKAMLDFIDAKYIHGKYPDPLSNNIAIDGKEIQKSILN